MYNVFENMALLTKGELFEGRINEGSASELLLEGMLAYAREVLDHLVALCLCRVLVDSGGRATYSKTHF